MFTRATALIVIETVVLVAALTVAALTSSTAEWQPVALVFVLLVPEQATEKHLQILSELAQLLSDRALRESLAQAPDAAALHGVVTAWQPDAPGRSRAAA